DAGGLLWLRRDDLSEMQSLRVSHSSAVASLAPLKNPEDCLCLSADGAVELIHVVELDDADSPVQARISRLGCIAAQPPLRDGASSSMPMESGMTPALCIGADDMALVVGPNEVWTVAGTSLAGPFAAQPATRSKPSE
ncbi:unnamed protein product, partial [Symbiodinium microadriaticum]